MRHGVIAALELQEEGRRLNAGYFLSEDEDAVRRIRAWPHDRTRLVDLVDAVFIGPIFRKVLADKSHGIGYISAIDVFKTDVRPNSYLSKSLGNLLQELQLVPGTILLTCSGMNLGRSVWVRPDMARFVGSADLIRIAPNASKAPPGFVYSFMASRYGVASVRRLIFGGHIKHVSPADVGRINVPRLGDEVEQKCDNMIRRAATLRTQSIKIIDSIAAQFDELVHGLALPASSPIIGANWSSSIQARMDAQFHDPRVRAIRERLREFDGVTVGDLCSKVFLPGIFKRIHATDAAFGAPYYTGTAIFSIDPVPKGILSRKTSLFGEVELERDTVLVQAFGQDGGITGRAAWVGEHLHGATTTHMLCRLRAADPRLSAYLFGFFASNVAYQQVRVLTYGGSIPHFDENGIRSVWVPLLGGERGAIKIGEELLDALRDRDAAWALEHQARSLVERIIEEAA